MPPLFLQRRNARKTAENAPRPGSAASTDAAVISFSRTAAHQHRQTAVRTQQCIAMKSSILPPSDERKYPAAAAKAPAGSAAANEIPRQRNSVRTLREKAPRLMSGRKKSPGARPRQSSRALPAAQSLSGAQTVQRNAVKTTAAAASSGLPVSSSSGRAPPK